jgi:hypothetical protein
MTDWNTDDAGGAGHCCYLVDKARNFTQTTLKIKVGGITFILTFIQYKISLLYSKTITKRKY